MAEILFFAFGHDGAQAAPSRLAPAPARIGGKLEVDERQPGFGAVAERAKGD